MPDIRFNLLSSRKIGTSVAGQFPQRILMLFLVAANFMVIIFGLADYSFFPLGASPRRPAVSIPASDISSSKLPVGVKDYLIAGDEGAAAAMRSDLASLGRRYARNDSAALGALERAHLNGIVITAVSFSLAEGGKYKVTGRARDEGVFVSFSDSISTNPSIFNFVFEARNDAASVPGSYPLGFTLRFEAGRR